MSAILLFLLGLATALPTHAEVILSIGPSAEPTRATLTINGSWPDQCPPVFQNARLVDHTLQVFAELPTDGICQPEPSNYRFTFTYDPVDTHRLELLLRRSPGQPYQLQEFALMGHAGWTRYQPETGWWWPQDQGLFDSGGPGTGLTLEVQGDILTVLSQSFDDAGRPSWRMAAGALRNNQFSAPLARFEGGQQFTGPYQAPVLSDDTQTLHLEFTGPVTATAWYTQRAGPEPDAPLSLRVVSLVRYSARGSLLDRMLQGQFVLIWGNENGSWRSRMLEIQGYEWMEGSQLRLLDSDGRELGRCQADPDNAEVPPDFCAINQPDQSAVVLDQMGLEQSHGRDLRGDLIRMLRID